MAPGMIEEDDPLGMVKEDDIADVDTDDDGVVTGDEDAGGVELMTNGQCKLSAIGTRTYDGGVGVEEDVVSCFDVGEGD